MSNESSSAVAGDNVVNFVTSTPSSTVPSFELPDASFLLDGHYEQVGFDLVVTNPAGEQFIVHDYFAFQPPPNLVLVNGAGLSPEMVQALLHKIGRAHV